MLTVRGAVPVVSATVTQFVRIRSGLINRR
jgi:hypothetical protein